MYGSESIKRSPCKEARTGLHGRSPRSALGPPTRAFPAETPPPYAPPLTHTRGGGDGGGSVGPILSGYFGADARSVAASRTTASIETSLRSSGEP
ncbi:hypothetical protein MTO96_000278 [Rhipicephalus appendiculatus]